jgi:tripartite-type tricarboxylate transporter receptor subunit TctC
MTFGRRKFLHLSAGAAALAATSRFTQAQGYPSRPVRVLVGLAAGSSLDILARLLGQWLSDRLGQPFVIENRPGGGTNVATEAVVKATPDGYTLLMISPANAVNATLYDKLNFNFIRDIAPVASIVREPQVMVVNPSLQAKTVPELIAYAKAHPGQLSMASAGNGTGSHMADELFKMMTGISMVHVPYRGGGPALTDFLGGQVQVMFPGTAASIEHIKAGRLRPLAVTATTRLQVVPDIPPMNDFVPGYESSFLNGIGAPKNAPTEIVERLNKEINTALMDSSIRGRLGELGGVVLPGSPADFAKLIADETEKWGKVINFAGIKSE